MAKHIGIAAASPEGSSLVYREVFRHAQRLVGDSGHPRVSLHNEPLEDYLAAVERDDWHTVGELMLKSARALASAGAEFAIAPDNLLQHGVYMAEPRSPIPWLKMTDLVAEAIARDGRKTVGIIGTKLVMYGSTYQTLLGIRGVKVVAPEAADAEMFHDVIMNELVHGEVTLESQTAWIGALARLMGRGCEGVILGCTEAPLLIGPLQSPLPVYDSTALLSEGAARRSLGL